MNHSILLALTIACATNCATNIDVSIASQKEKLLEDSNLVSNKSNGNSLIESNLFSQAETSEIQKGLELVIAGRAKLVAQDFQAALELFKKAIAIFRKEDNLLFESRTLNFIGNTYQGLQQFKEAVSSYTNALNLLSAILIRNSYNSPQLIETIALDEIVIFQNLADLHYRNGNIQDVIAFYKEALERSQLVKNPIVKATILEKLGGVYLASKNFNESLSYSQQALDIHKQQKSDRTQSPLLLNIGFSYRQLGQTDKALEFYQQALKAARPQGDRLIEVTILNNIASVYRTQGKYSQALQEYQTSLKLAQSLSLEKQELITLSNIGVLYKNIGQYDNALNFLEQGLKKAQAVGDRQTESIILNNIGSIYGDRKDYQRALEYYNQALANHLALSDYISQGRTLNNIGNAYESLKQLDQANRYYQQSLKIAREVSDLSTEAKVLSNLASVYQSKQQFSEALKLGQHSIALHRQLGERQGESLALSNLGDLFAAHQQPDLAILFYKQSVNIREALRQELRSLSLEEQKTFTGIVAITYRNLADLLLKQNRILESQQVLDLLKVQELDEYLENLQGNSKTAKGIELLSNEQRFLTDYLAMQNRFVQAGKELIDFLKIPTTDRTPQQIKRIQELRDIQERSLRQMDTYIQDPAIIAILKSLQGNDDANLQQFKALQAQLQQRSPQAAIFYPLLLDDRLELILVTAQGNPIRRTVAISKAELTRTIIDFRATVRDPSSLDVLEPAQQLYNWLLKPIQADLKQASITTIIYAPDAQLRYLPLAALHDGKQWLVETYVINTITAASLTNLSDRPSQKFPRVLAGAFTAGQYVFKVNGETFDFAGLPFAGTEVNNLVAKLPNSTKLINDDFGASATIAKFSDYNIIHLATHAAFIKGKPEDSFVVFGDGSRASLRDVATWSLRNVDLIILSACETGLGGQLGNGSEIMGFGYQMEYAGAKAAIASLWQVSDGGTQDLMDRFYTLLQNPQIGKAEVLAQAQRAMLTIPTRNPSEPNMNFSHPYYWSPFILIGNGI